MRIPTHLALAFCSLSLGWAADNAPAARSAATAVPLRLADGTTSGGISGPVLGYLPRANAGLRPVMGIPGAATLGQEVSLGSAGEVAAAPPGQNFAIVAGAGAARLVYLDGREGELSLTPAPGVPERIVFSPSGDSAVLIGDAGQRLVVFAGLPASPRLAFDAANSTGGALGPVAVADGGAAVAAGLSGVAAGSAGAWTASGFFYLPVQGDVSGLAFQRGSTALIAADRASSQIWRIQNLDAGPTAELLASQSEGLNAPLAVGISRDGRHVFAANGSGGRVLRLNLAARSTDWVDCGCQPDRLQAMSGNAVFQLNTPQTGAPMLVLDADASQPRVVFVPADAPALDRTGADSRLPGSGRSR